MSEKDKGAYKKFTVKRTDERDGPGDEHKGCTYFVLDLMCDPHARAAMVAYATSCVETHPQLSKDIWDSLADNYLSLGGAFEQKIHASGED